MKANRLRKNSEEITKQKLERRIGFDVLNDDYVLRDSCGGGLDLIFCDSIYSSTNSLLYEKVLRKK